ncbi:MAG: tRNA 2-thiouridine(34) synthase MnmA [Oscillospiraceae bacterium]
MEKVILGLSGGVDSAVAASLLRSRGFDVHGVYLDIGLGGDTDARVVAGSLGIPLEICDIRAELDDKVCTRFASSYLAGKTPNPCMLCNPNVKFPTLLRMADKLGGQYVATGHYARCEDSRLFKGKPSNDQSYMLSRLTPQQLKRCLFPLGGMEKVQVRALAEKLDLPVAHKPDSMEICFIPDGDYAAFIASRGEVPPEGNFVDERGQVLGRHRGIHHYTLGQRKRLGIALGKRIFVSAIDSLNNTVTLSDDDVLSVNRAEAEEANWLISPPDGGFDADVRVRHSKLSYPAHITPLGTGFTIEFSAPVRAPTPGQAAVGYIGDEVVCSGWII